MDAISRKGQNMSIEETFATALEYETRIRDQYLEAARSALIPEAKAFYEILGRDEDSHVAYIKHKLDQWRGAGSIDASGLSSLLPPAADLSAAIAKAQAGFSAIPEGGQLAALQNALRAEEETSAFYRSMVGTLPDGARQVFARLLEIEDGHSAIVRAELDLVSRTGHWFDVREFDMEE
jgi:rubrerythrin